MHLLALSPGLGDILLQPCPESKRVSASLKEILLFHLSQLTLVSGTCSQRISANTRSEFPFFPLRHNFSLLGFSH